MNPSKVYLAQDEDPSIEGIMKLTVFKNEHVGKQRQSYVSEPLTEYQRLLRIDSTELFNHVTRPFDELNVERIVRVAMEPGADHHSNSFFLKTLLIVIGLPEKLKPWCLHDPASASSRHGGWKGLFGRLDYFNHFQTALTDMQPMGKQGVSFFNSFSF